MPLTVRSNGSLSANIITSSWFNDYRDLLTGAMTDQEVTIKNNVVIQAISGPPATAPTLAVVAGTGLGIGAYKYLVTFTSPDGETISGPNATATTTTGNQKVNLTAIATGSTGTTGRKVYRTKVGGSTYFLLTTLADNTTTTYTDIIADASLPATSPPTSPSLGGSLVIKDQTGAVTYKVNNDGSVSAGGSSPFVTFSGTTSGTATVYEQVSGSIKTVVIFFSALKNGSTGGPNTTYPGASGISLPVPFTKFAQYQSGNQQGFSFLSGGANGTLLTLDNFLSQSNFGAEQFPASFTWGDINSGFDYFLVTAANASPHTGVLTIIGV